MKDILLLLGGNIGDVPRTFAMAEALLQARGIAIRARSRDHWTEPWGFHDQRPFLNRALLVDGGAGPEDLMRNCLEVEQQLGRVRDGQGYASRTIDIDVLFMQDLRIDTPLVTIPHPRVHERRFALAPAADLAPELVHPVLGRTVLSLLNDAT